MCLCVLNCFSHVRLFAAPWTVARQHPLSMGFSKQEYWSGLPFPFPGEKNLPSPGIEPASPTSSALEGGFFTTSAPWVKTPCCLVAKSCHRVQLFCDPIDCRPSSCSIHGISLAKILEWVAISFSR